jgi:hypothetical protein
MLTHQEWLQSPTALSATWGLFAMSAQSRVTAKPHCTFCHLRSVCHVSPWTVRYSVLPAAITQLVGLPRLGVGARRNEVTTLQCGCLLQCQQAVRILLSYLTSLSSWPPYNIYCRKQSYKSIFLIPVCVSLVFSIVLVDTVVLYVRLTMQLELYE